MYIHILFLETVLWEDCPFFFLIDTSEAQTDCSKSKKRRLIKINERCVYEGVACALDTAYDYNIKLSFLSKKNLALAIFEHCGVFVT